MYYMSVKNICADSGNCLRRQRLRPQQIVGRNQQASKRAPSILACIKLHERGHKEGDAAKDGGDDKEVEVTRDFLQHTAHQAGQHHAQGHEARAESVVGC